MQLSHFSRVYFELCRFCVMLLLCLPYYGRKCIGEGFDDDGFYCTMLKCRRPTSIEHSPSTSSPFMTEHILINSIQRFQSYIYIEHIHAWAPATTTSIYVWWRGVGVCFKGTTMTMKATNDEWLMLIFAKRVALSPHKIAIWHEWHECGTHARSAGQ